MKRVVLAIVSTVASLVLLLSFKTHSTSALAPPPAAVSSSASTGVNSSGSKSPSSGSKSPSSGSKSASSGSSATSYTGSAAQTPYGPVQVEVTVKNGKVTAVTALEYPTTDPRDAQINSYAIPALNSEATAAGSANIDMVSGATYTSQGYLSSLQSALDQAGL